MTVYITVYDRRGPAMDVTKPAPPGWFCANAVASYTWRCTYACVDTCAPRTCACIYQHKYICTYMRARARTHARTRAHAHTRTHMHPYINACAHTCTCAHAALGRRRGRTLPSMMSHRSSVELWAATSAGVTSRDSCRRACAHM